MDKLDMQSPDFTDQNIEKLAALFPNCVTEAKDKNGKLQKAIDFDLLKQELSNNIVDGPRESYQLNWPGKREALLTANTPITKTLRPVRSESVDFDSTENLFIEGDNLDALKLLQETYLGKVKMIYIDPPYNTGKDFVYSDNFTVDKDDYDALSEQKDEDGGRLVANPDSNGRFHSDWLDMIYPRLKLARNLLRDDGVIFISIDDNEQANLKRLCDEVFGENNFIHCLVWQKKVSPSNDSKFFSNDHEYILVIAKSKNSGVINRLERTTEHNKYYKNPDNDPIGDWNSTAATCNKNHEERPNLYYSIKNPTTDEDIWPRKEAVWAFSQIRMAELLSEGRIYWGADGTSKSPRVKNYLNEAKKVVPRSVLLYSKVGHTQSATSEFRSLMPNLSFDYPKPSSLIKHLINICSIGEGLDDFITLDFFAGSSTTAHAVMQLNAEDNGNRKFIMVQLPEVTNEKSEAFKAGYTTIAEISKERIRRAGQKIKEDNADKEGIEQLDTGFRVLKVDSSNMKEVYYAPDQIIQADLIGLADNIKEDRNAEDLLFQVLLDWGVDLSLPITREVLTTEHTENTEEKIKEFEVFFVDSSYEAPALCACFEKDVNEALVKQIAKRKPLRAVFRDAGYGSDSTKINIKQIFTLISPHTEVKAI